MPSKMLEATCSASVVKVGVAPVVEAVILSKGLGASTGILVMDEDRATYVTSNAQDISDLIDKVADVLAKIYTALEGVNSMGVGTQTAEIALIPAAQTALVALKETLK